MTGREVQPVEVRQPQPVTISPGALALALEGIAALALAMARRLRGLDADRPALPWARSAYEDDDEDPGRFWA